MLAGEQPVEQRRADIADMQQPGGRRCYANGDSHDVVLAGVCGWRLLKNLLFLTNLW
jgi:hypothetical protein